MWRAVSSSHPALRVPEPARRSGPHAFKSVMGQNLSQLDSQDKLAHVFTFAKIVERRFSVALVIYAGDWDFTIL
jgi:hypothetical protein